MRKFLRSAGKLGPFIPALAVLVPGPRTFDSGDDGVNSVNPRPGEL